MSTRFILGATVVAAVLSLGTAAWAQGAAPSGNADQGKRLFVNDGCYQCHGYVGQGGNAGPRLAPAPVAFEAFSKQLREPQHDMPPYGEKILSDKDAADIYAYLQTVPKPPAVKDIPLLNQ
ncbi:MAG TPA: cytochrome c [Alphaproteobacteria bacterium]